MSDTRLWVGMSEDHGKQYLSIAWGDDEKEAAISNGFAGGSLPGNYKEITTFDGFISELDSYDELRS